MDLPDDLRPLPTVPYDERPDSLPLDIEECRTALWLHRGNVSDAAKRLKVSPSRLRSMVRNSPRLAKEAEEAREQLVDIAEDAVYSALTDPDDPGRRDTMARFVLTNLGNSRGYGSKGGNSVNINAGGGKKISVTWGDGTSLSVEGKAEKVIEHE